jgi:hypothetical protein
MNHTLIDERSRQMDILIAERLRCDPSLLRYAKENLARWRLSASPNVVPTLDEWEALLNGNFELGVASPSPFRSTRHRDACRSTARNKFNNCCSSLFWNGIRRVVLLAAVFGMAATTGYSSTRAKVKVRLIHLVPGSPQGSGNDDFYHRPQNSGFHPLTGS